MALFISDLHLDASRPAASAAFLHFLEHDAQQADALYILGDLFEYWISDDDTDPHNRTIIEGLAKLTKSGVKCYVMHGNRDFLIGKQFASESGTTLLHDPTVIYAGGKSVLITHGDALCTDDVDYQRFKKIIRSNWFKFIFSSLPYAIKTRIAANARRKSAELMETKPPEILDVNQQAVADTLKQYKVDTLLHGHTHRPAIHHFEAERGTMTRIVLGDWYESGSVLRWDAAGPQLTSLDFTNDQKRTG